MRIFTIGFTQKSAQDFFELLKNSGVETVVDIRLNNTSQLAGFAKYPDIKYFLKAICDIDYVHDTTFAPTEEIMKNYKNKKTDWTQFEKEFNELLNQRNIEEHIKNNYETKDNICLLCSEAQPQKCHRKLTAQKFSEIFNGVQIQHL